MKNYDELIAYLIENPCVNVTDESGTLPKEHFGHRRYTRHTEVGIYFVDEDGKESFSPVNCQIDGNPGFSIDEKGFSVTKFGVTIRYDFEKKDPFVSLVSAKRSEIMEAKTVEAIERLKNVLAHRGVRLDEKTMEGVALAIKPLFIDGVEFGAESEKQIWIEAKRRAGQGQ